MYVEPQISVYKGEGLLVQEWYLKLTNFMFCTAVVGYKKGFFIF